MLNRHDIIGLAITLSVLCFAVVAAILLLRTRERLAVTTANARDEIIASRAEVDRVYALLRSEPQILVAWAAADDEPEIIGDVGLVTEADSPYRVLAFGLWLEPEAAQAIENAVSGLRERGEKFAMALTTLAGRPIEADGQVVGGRAILRFKDVSGVKRELTELTGRFQHQVDDANAMRTLVEGLPSPIWARDEAGKLIYVNAAYARAVDAKDPGEVIARGTELFDRAARTDLFRAHEAERNFAGRLPAIVGGGRVIFDVLTFPTRRGSAGIGIDATEADAMRAELKRMVDAHRRTFDYLATGVAIFGADGRLTFYNTAFRSLWDLDVTFLDQSPSDSAILDRLRDGRRLAEQHDFRRWKAELHEAYRATEAKCRRMAPARRPHAARRHHAQPGRRRDLSLRRHHRAARPAAPLRGADPRAGRDPRQSGGRRRGVRERRAAAAVQSGVRADVEVRSGVAAGASARRGRDRLVPCPRRRQSDLAAAPHDRHRDRRPHAGHRRDRTARRQRGQMRDRARCRTAPRWSRSRTSPTPSMSSARCASATKRSKTPTRSRSISSTTFRTSCARRSPTSSASRISSATTPPGR